MSRVAIVSLIIFAFFASGCGGGGGGGGGRGGVSVKGTLIGSAGGTATQDEGEAAGSSVTVPAGAVDSDTDFTIEDGDPVSEAGFLVTGPAVSLGPSGMYFAESIEVEIPYDPTRIPAGSSAADMLVLKEDDDSGDVVSLQPVNVDTVSETVTVLTASFSTFQVASPSGGHLVLTRQPADTEIGVSLTPAPVVEVHLSDGSLDVTASSQIVADLGANPNEATLHGSIGRFPVGGVADWSNIHINRVGRGFTLVFTSGTMTPLESNPIDSSRGPADHLVFVVQPSNGEVGVYLDPVVTVAFRDSNGDPVPTAIDQIRISLEPNSAGASLGGTTSRDALSGGDTLFSTSVSHPGQGYRIIAEADEVTSAISDPFDVVSSPPQNLRGRNVASTSMSLRWLDHNPDSVEVEIQIAEDDGSDEPGTWAPLATVAAGATTYDVTGLTPKTRYWFRARTVTTSSTSEWSEDVTAPTEPEPLTDIEDIAVGRAFVVAVKSNGSVWGWGDNGSHQLTDTGNADEALPVAITPLANVESIAAGSGHVLAVRTDGKLEVWGENAAGQLGLGSKGADVSLPTEHPALVDVAEVSAGIEHSVALKSDGTVWVWGSNGALQLGPASSNPEELSPVQVPGLSNIQAIAAGGYHTLVLKNDGTVWAWGEGDSGQLGDGNGVDSSALVQVAGVSDVEDIAAGRWHSIAKAVTGKVWTWGINSEGQIGNGWRWGEEPSPVEPGAGFDASLIACGWEYTLAVEAQGENLYGWGRGQEGALGYYFASPHVTFAPATPYPLRTSESALIDEIIKIQGGEALTAILKPDGTVECMGRNSEGQMGIGSDVDAWNSPTRVWLSSGIVPVRPYVNGLTATTVKRSTLEWERRSHEMHSFRIYWAPDNGGAPGAWTSIDISSAAQLEYEFTALSPATTYWFRMTALGRNGESVSSSAFSYTTPALGAVRPDDPENLSAQSQSSRVVRVFWQDRSLDEDGFIIQRATDNDGEPGIWSEIHRTSAGATSWEDETAYGDTTFWYRVIAFNGAGESEPTNHDSITTWHDVLDNVDWVSMGHLSGFARLKDGSTVAWGANGDGQLGDEGAADRRRPVVVPGLDNFVQITAGESHGIGLHSDGTVWTWGDNTYGQLGDGSVIANKTPTQVSGLANVTAVAAGYQHSIALMQDKTVRVWGLDNAGQVGAAGDNKTPLQPSITDVIAIAGGESHTVALKSDGTVWAWGRNAEGQLGDGTGNFAAGSGGPQQVQGLGNVTAIAAGVDSNLALLNDKTVVGWGRNDNNQLGQGVAGHLDVPTAISGLADIEKIAHGGGYGAALDGSGQLFYWGFTGYSVLIGNLGYQILDDRKTPLALGDPIAQDFALGYATVILVYPVDETWCYGNNSRGACGLGRDSNYGGTLGIWEVVEPE